jgi:protein disulfide-isomerase A6
MDGCPHCAKVDPMWEEARTKLAKEAGVAMERWDVKDPDGKAKARAAGVSSFPTIKRTPAGGGAPVAFKGDRTAANIEALCRGR